MLAKLTCALGAYKAALDEAQETVLKLPRAAFNYSA
jgi:hypothetical protein